MFKKWFDKAKKFCKENPELVVAGGVVIGVCAICAMPGEKEPEVKVIDLPFEKWLRAVPPQEVDFMAFRDSAARACGIAIIEKGTKHVRSTISGTPDEMIGICSDVIEIANDMKGEK